MNKLLLLSSCATTMGMMACSGQAVEQAPKPNIIYILADDLGYGDLGILGQKTIPTPNIDRLAAEGMIFTNHYAGAPVSGPSRGCLMTGKHTGHSTIRGNKAIPGVGVVPISPSDITLPEAIKTNTDYVTGMCGRWHLGGELTDQTPFHRGFDYHFGKLSADFLNRHGVMIDLLWNEKGEHIPYSEYSKKNVEPMYENGNYYNLSEQDQQERPINMDRLVTNRALDFIVREKEKPFFLYVAYSLVHAPMEYHSDTPVSANDWPEAERCFASMVMSLDKYVGEIMECVDREGLGERTMIIFASDNGAHNEGHDYRFFRSTGDFRGYKRDLYEGGCHTSMFARWTGTIPAGSKTDLLSAFWDVMPTICELGGAPIPQQTDGISFAPTLLGKSQLKKHEYLYFEFDECSDRIRPRKEFKQSVVFDHWKVIKYIDTDKIEVYDLEKDPTEDHDLASKHPELVAKALKYMDESHVQNQVYPLTLKERNKLKR